MTCVTGKHQTENCSLSSIMQHLICSIILPIRRIFLKWIRVMRAWMSRAPRRRVWIRRVKMAVHALASHPASGRNFWQALMKRPICISDGMTENSESLRKQCMMTVRYRRKSSTGSLCTRMVMKDTVMDTDTEVWYINLIHLPIRQIRYIRRSRVLMSVTIKKPMRIGLKHAIK